jgi:hypothetical protein
VSARLVPAWPDSRVRTLSSVITRSHEWLYVATCLQWVWLNTATYTSLFDQGMQSIYHTYKVLSWVTIRKK